MTPTDPAQPKLRDHERLLPAYNNKVSEWNTNESLEKNDAQRGFSENNNAEGSRREAHIQTQKVVSSSPMKNCPEKSPCEERCFKENKAYLGSGPWAHPVPGVSSTFIMTTLACFLFWTTTHRKVLTSVSFYTHRFHVTPTEVAMQNIFHICVSHAHVKSTHLVPSSTIID